MKNFKKYFLLVGFDLVFIALALTFTFLFKGVQPTAIPHAYGMPILIFTVVWLLGSAVGKKFQTSDANKPYAVLAHILRVNVLLMLALTFIIFFANMNYSRGVLLGATVLTTLYELAAAWMNGMLKGASEVRESGKNGSVKADTRSVAAAVETAGESLQAKVVAQFTPIAEGMQATVIFDSSGLKSNISELTGEAGFEFINNILVKYPGQTLFVATSTVFNIQVQPVGSYSNIVNLKRINDIQRINKFFEEVNAKLPEGGVFIDCVETTAERRSRIMAKFPPVLNSVYYFIDYVFKRVFPKLPVTKEIYFLLTRGNNRVLSKAETWGRLYSCGFELLGEIQSDNLIYFAARKMKAPEFDMTPTYGPLIRLRRYGYDGKLIGVYKMRTMHPYAEYLQKYMYEKYDLAEGGKIANDFRITTAGRIMRRLWLDELPMVINWFKGDLKLVGVRPLSRHYFSLYPEDMQKRRSRYKPGLVPPFYVDMPKTLEDIVESERCYLEAYDRHPLRTDWVYLWRALYNILVRKARSG